MYGNYSMLSFEPVRVPKVANRGELHARLNICLTYVLVGNVATCRQHQHFFSIPSRQVLLVDTRIGANTEILVRNSRQAEYQSYRMYKNTPMKKYWFLNSQLKNFLFDSGWLAPRKSRPQHNATYMPRLSHFTLLPPSVVGTLYLLTDPSGGRVLSKPKCMYCLAYIHKVSSNSAHFTGSTYS